MKVEIFTWILSFTFVAFGGQKTGTQFGTTGWFSTVRIYHFHFLLIILSFSSHHLEYHNHVFYHALAFLFFFLLFSTIMIIIIIVTISIVIILNHHCYHNHCRPPCYHHCRCHYRHHCMVHYHCHQCYCITITTILSTIAVTRHCDRTFFLRLKHVKLCCCPASDLFSLFITWKLNDKVKIN